MDRTTFGFLAEKWGRTADMGKIDLEKLYYSVAQEIAKGLYEGKNGEAGVLFPY